jgi:DNA-binding response OmpR family regulator
MHTILLVDDDEDLLQSLAFTLSGEDYKVVQGKTGAEAVTKAFELRPDLILLDIMMPNLDGLTACRGIRSMEETKRIPIIMLTAKGDVETIKAAFKAGANDYVVKPFIREKVLGKIEEFLGLGKAKVEKADQ